MKEIFKKIKQYNTIIIHRHTNPDLDAYGSQMGLKYAIKAKFPQKHVYVVGDENRFKWIGALDNITDDVYQGALVIILDVAVSSMISDLRYFLASEVIVIDHHKNPCVLDIEDKKFDKPLYTYIHPEYGACAEIIAKFADEYLEMNESAATPLYGGIVTDTGRFQYGNHLEHSLLMGAYLVAKGANPQFIYNNLYVESLESRLMKNYFSSKMQLTDKNVAYMFNDLDVYEKYDIDTFSVSRGMVNLMAGIEGVYIWANFTRDKETKKVICEFRSRGVECLPIAIKYGGGGHEFACGATIEDFDVAKEVLNDFDLLVEEYLNAKENL